MLKKFLFLGAAALAMTATSTIAADASRARLMIPIQASELCLQMAMKDTNHHQLLDIICSMSILQALG